MSTPALCQLPRMWRNSTGCPGYAPVLAASSVSDTDPGLLSKSWLDRRRVRSGARRSRAPSRSLDHDLTHLIPPVVLPSGNGEADGRPPRDRIEQGDTQRV